MTDNNRNQPTTQRDRDEEGKFTGGSEGSRNPSQNRNEPNQQNQNQPKRDANR